MNYYVFIVEKEEWTLFQNVTKVAVTESGALVLAVQGSLRAAFADQEWTAILSEADFQEVVSK